MIERNEFPSILDVEGVSRYLHVAPITVYRLLSRKRKNEFPAHKLGGVWRFYRDEVDAWLKDRR